MQQTRRSNSLTFEKLDDARTYNGYVRNDYKWILTLGSSYVDAPLVVKNASNSDQLQELIKYIQGFHLGGGYYFKPWLMVGVETAFNIFKDNNNESYSGFSDPQLKARFRFYNDKRLAFAIAPFVNINLNQGDFDVSNAIATSNMNGVKVSALSDEGLGLGFNFIAEYLFRSVQIVANIGYQNSSHAIDKDSLGNTQVDYRSTLLTGAGAYVPINRVWGLNFEFLRQWSFDLFNNDQERNEFFMGAAGALNQRLHAYAGLGLGNFVSSDDGNDFRISAGLKYIGYSDQQPRKPLRALIVTQKNRIESTDLHSNETASRSESGSKTDLNINGACDSRYIFGQTNFAVIRFQNNSSLISEKNEDIKKLAEHLLYFKDDIDKIEIHGHSSSRSEETYNLNLALSRAVNTKKYFQFKGLIKTNIEIKGFGEKELLQSEIESDSESEAPNRRVEIKVTLKESFNGCK